MLRRSSEWECVSAGPPQDRHTPQGCGSPADEVCRNREDKSALGVAGKSYRHKVLFGSDLHTPRTLPQIC